MKTMIGAIVLAAACVVVQADLARAQTVAEPDRTFMLEAARGGIAEVELGRLAAQRAATEPVRQFGQRMVTDHGNANQQLMRLAQSRGVTLPREMGAEHRATMDRLTTLSGPAFDQAYMTEMVRDHQKDAAAFMRAARESQDADVRAWAAQTLPMIQEHQRLAYDIHSRTAQAPAPPAAVAASPATVTTVITTTTTPLPPYCGGAYVPGVGTNFAGCPR